MKEEKHGVIYLNYLIDSEMELKSQMDRGGDALKTQRKPFHRLCLFRRVPC